jgi:hypothetical protein
MMNPKMLDPKIAMSWMIKSKIQLPIDRFSGSSIGHCVMKTRIDPIVLSKTRGLHRKNNKTQ